MAFFLFVWPSLRFSSREASLYLGAFTKVVPFDDTMAAATIRADQKWSPRIVARYGPILFLSSLGFLGCFGILYLRI